MCIGELDLRCLWGVLLIRFDLIFKKIALIRNEKNTSIIYKWEEKDEIYKKGGEEVNVEIENGTRFLNCRRESVKLSTTIDYQHQLYQLIVIN